MTIIQRDDPRAMTTRARVYIQAAGFRHGAVGLSLLIFPWLYSSAAFIPIFNYLPLHVWGWIMLLEGLLCTSAAFSRRAQVARLSMGVSAVLTMLLAVGISIGITASWFFWINAVGGDQAWALVVSHPPTFPAYLLGFAPAPPSPFIPFVMLALTVKDFTMCAQPLRVPLEESVGNALPGRV